MLPLPPQGVRLVIRHGMYSNGANMGVLRDGLMNRLALILPEVDNQSYNWEATILRNGVELAGSLVAAPAAPGLVLVGHSMGGLVCRIANCALTDPNFMNVVNAHAKEFRDDDMARIQATRLAVHRVRAIVTIATPNSGAMTHSQIAIAGHLLEHATNALFAMTPGAPVWHKSEGVADLRSDRIFRILQNCRTATPCLSVSGSWGNRFLRGMKGGAGHRLLQWIAGMREPHDMVVEDESVNLGRSVLPHEFVRPPKHYRRYIDCTAVTHTNIHETPAVHDLVARFIQAHP